MATATHDSLEYVCAPPGTAGPANFVVRQPVLDLHGRVHAFKLLFGESPSGEIQKPGGRKMLDWLTYFELRKPSEFKKLTGSLAAFVDCDGEMLRAQLAQALPASLTILEIPSSVEPVPETIAICQELKAQGFRLALDGFGWEPHHEPLVELADYIKVDFGAAKSDARRNICERMHARRLELLASHIETQAGYRQAREEGFTLFAGAYYYQPPVARNRRPPANQLLRIDILKALQQRPMDLHKMSQLVMRDGPLAYQLLRFVNSPICALRQEVQSIETALLTLGEDTFRRIATLAIASQFNGDQPAELLCMAIIRGRFCEVAAASHQLNPFSQYMLGLLSLLPSMQGQPMSEIAPTLPLGPAVRDALLGTKCRERVILGWLEGYERGDWAACHAAALADGLNQGELAKIYVEAVEWAEAALHSAS